MAVGILTLTVPSMGARNSGKASRGIAVLKRRRRRQSMSVPVEGGNGALASGEAGMDVFVEDVADLLPVPLGVAAGIFVGEAVEDELRR